MFDYIYLFFTLLSTQMDILPCVRLEEKLGGPLVFPPLMVASDGMITQTHDDSRRVSRTFWGLEAMSSTQQFIFWQQAVLCFPWLFLPASIISPLSSLWADYSLLFTGAIIH